jgi:hypothetical protein
MCSFTPVEYFRLHLEFYVGGLPRSLLDRHPRGDLSQVLPEYFIHEDLLLCMWSCKR